MDEFPHITVEHKVLKRHVQFKFNPERCRRAGLEEIPNADKYEVVKLRRVYHFNKDTSDHVVLTIPKPLFVVVDKGHVPVENSLETYYNGKCTTEQQITYQNVKNKESRSEEYSFGTSEDEVIIEKCVPEVVTLSNRPEKRMETINNITKSFCDVLQPKSTIICDEYNSSAIILECASVISNSSDNEKEPTRGEELLSIIAVHPTVPINPPDLAMANNQSHNNNIFPTQEPTPGPQANKEIIENELDALSVFDEFSINEQIFSEENSQIQDISFGIPPEILEPTPIVEISATDEILWAEFYQSNAGEVSTEKPLEFYDESSSALDPIEEEMRKIHGEYIVQEHSYVQPLISKEDGEFVSSRNFNLLELFKTQKTVEESVEDVSQILQRFDEPFEMQPLAIDEETDEELGSEILNFIVAQGHTCGTSNSQECAPRISQENFNGSTFNSSDTIKPNGKIQKPSVQENSNQQETLVELRKVQNPNNPEENRVIQSAAVEIDVIGATIADKNNPEEHNTSWKNLKMQPCLEMSKKNFEIHEKLADTCSEKDLKIMEKDLQGPTVTEPKVVEESIKNSVEKDSENLKNPNRISVIVNPTNLNKNKCLENGIQGDFNEKDTKSLEEPITKEPQISEQSIGDGPIAKQPQSIEKPVQANHNANRPKFLKTVIRDGYIENRSSIVEQLCNESPKQSIQGGSIAEEPLILKKLLSNLNERRHKALIDFMQDHQYTKEPQNLENSLVANPIDRRLTFLRSAARDDSIEEKSKILQEPIQDSPITKESQIQKKPIDANLGENPPKSLENIVGGNSSEERSKILEQLIQDITNAPLIQEKPIEANLEESRPMSLENIVGVESIEKRTASLEQLIQDNPIIKPKIVEEPIKSNFNQRRTKLPVTTVPDGSIEGRSKIVQQPIQDIPVTKQPQIQEKPIEASLEENRPKSLKVVGDDSMENKATGLVQLIQYGPIIMPVKGNLNKQSPKLSKTVQVDSIEGRSKIREQPIQSTSITKGSQIQPKLIALNFESRSKPLEDVGDDCIDKRSTSLEHGDSITNVRHIREKPVNNNLKKRRPKLSETAVRDDSIEERSKNAEQPIQCRAISKESLIREKPFKDNVHKCSKRSKILKQPILDGPIAKEPQVMVKPILSNFNEGQPKLFENSVVKDGLILKELKIILKPIQVHLDERQPQFLENPIQDVSLEKESIFKKPKILQKLITDASISEDPRILKKPILDTFTERNPEILETPIQAHNLKETVPQTDTKKKFLEKPVASVVNIKKLETATKICQQRLLGKVTRKYPIKQKPKLLEKSLLNFIDKDPKTVENSGEWKRQKIVKKCLQDIPTQQKPNILKKPVSNAIEKDHKILENSIQSNTAKKCFGDTMPKMSIQNHIERELKILEKSVSNSLEKDNVKKPIDGDGHNMTDDCTNGITKQEPKILEKSLQSPLKKDHKILEKDSEHNMEKKCLDGRIEKVSIQNSINRAFKIAKKYISSAIQNRPKILENSIQNHECIVVAKCVNDTVAKVFNQNLIQQKPKILKQSLKDSKFIEKPIKRKRCKIAKESFKSTINKVPKIQEKFLQDLETVSKTSDKPIQTPIRNEFKIPENPFDDASENEFDSLMDEPLQDAIEKVLKILEKPLENIPKHLRNTPQSNLEIQHENFEQESKIVEDTIETEPDLIQKQIKSVNNTIKNQNEFQSPQKPIVDAISNKQKNFNLLDIFEMDDIAYPPIVIPETPNTKDPLDEEMCRIHEESTNRNEVSSTKAPNKQPINKRPVSQEPVAKKHRSDPEEEELDFKGFTREEQNSTPDLRSIRDSPVSVVECDKSVCSTPITELNNPTKLKAIDRRINGMYKCNECDFKARKQTHLRVHARTHLQPYWCNLCLETFPVIQNLEQHVKRYHDIDKNNCKPDKNKSNTEDVHITTVGRNLRNSQNSEKPSNKIDPPAYKCGFCNYSSSYIKRLQYHVKVHKREKLYSCDRCNYATLTKWMIDRHVSDHVAENQQYECEECGYISIYRDELNEHMKLHSSQKVYICDKCSFSTAQLGYFNAHVSFHLPKDECAEYADGDDEEVIMEPQIFYTCQECAYFTKQHTMLFKHARKAHEQKMCVKVLAKNNNKLYHMCTQCGFWAQSQEAFKKHSAMHTDIKPNKCDLCAFVTDNEYNLKLHKANHGIMKSFKCPKCNRNCTTMLRLKDHFVKVHKGDVNKLLHKIL